MSSPIGIEHLQLDVEDNLRELHRPPDRRGYSVAGGQGADPLLIDPGGKAVETWREDYPYDEPLDRDVYEEQKYLLQIELLKLQYWGEDHGERHILLFEGRDAAGEGGTIKRFMEHLNPRAARVVALTKPTTTEAGQWYFQRRADRHPAGRAERRGWDLGTHREMRACGLEDAARPATGS